MPIPLLASLLGREHAIKTRGAETARSRGAGTMHVCMIVATAVVPFPGVATHARSVTVARPCRRGRCPPPLTFFHIIFFGVSSRDAVYSCVLLLPPVAVCVSPISCTYIEFALQCSAFASCLVVVKVLP